MLMYYGKSGEGNAKKGMSKMKYRQYETEEACTDEGWEL